VREPSPPVSENVAAAIADDGAEGVHVVRIRAAANARGKALAKEKEVGVDNKDPAGTATILAAHPAKKVSRNEIVFVNIE
jgi:hypothetical protein